MEEGRDGGKRGRGKEGGEGRSDEGGRERGRVEGRREGERERGVEAFACLICTVCTYTFVSMETTSNKFSQQLDEATGNTVRKNASKGRQTGASVLSTSS